MSYNIYTDIPAGATKRSLTYFSNGTERYRKLHQSKLVPKIIFYNCFSRKALLEYQCGHQVVIFRPERYAHSMIDDCPECYRIKNSYSSIEKALKHKQAKLANTDEIKQRKSINMASRWKDEEYTSKKWISEEKVRQWVESLDGWSYISHEYINRNWVVHVEHLCGEKRDLYYLRESRCNKCNPYSSNEELELYKFVQSIYPDTKKLYHCSDVDNLELDIYIPSLNIGFEYNGVYWHSSKFHNSSYHNYKVNKFLSKGIIVYSLWSYWGLEKCKDIILSKLGKLDKIYARKCIVCEPNRDEVYSFLCENHNLGPVKYSEVKALKYNGELIQLIALSKRDGKAELSRLATKRGFICVGGFSKLLKSLDYKGELVSYSFSDLNPDYRETVYFKNGFKYLSSNKYSMSYYNLKTREVISRRNYQKKKLKELFPLSYDSSLTERQILLKENIIPIYDSGTHKFMIKL